MKLRTKCLKLEGSWSRQPLLPTFFSVKTNFERILFAPLLTFPSHRSTSSLRFLQPGSNRNNPNCSPRRSFRRSPIYDGDFSSRGEGGDDVFFFDDKINPVERWKILEDWINENSKGANDAFNIELVVHCRALFEHRFVTPLPLEATANYRNLLTSCSTVSFEQFFLLSIRTIRRIDFLNLLAPKFSYSIEKYIDTRNKNILRVINTCSRSFDRGIRNDSSSHSRTEICSIRYRTKLISFLSFSSPIKNYTPWFR